MMLFLNNADTKGLQTYLDLQQTPVGIGEVVSSEYTWDGTTRRGIIIIQTKIIVKRIIHQRYK